MEDTVYQNNYELSFYIDPDIGEEEAKSYSQKIHDVIDKDKGANIKIRELRLSRLSYPIHHKRSGYLGVINFTAGPEITEKLNAHLKLETGVMRYLILNLPDEPQKLRILGTRISRYRRPASEKKEVSPRSKEKAAESSEQLEQEVEKVIEGL